MNPILPFNNASKNESLDLPIPFSSSIKSLIESKTLSIPRVLCMNAIEIIPEMLHSSDSYLRKLGKSFNDNQYHGEARLIFSMEEVSHLASTFFGESEKILDYDNFKKKEIFTVGNKIFSFFTENFSMLLRFELDSKVPIRHLERIVEIHRSTAPNKQEAIVIAGFVDFLIGENDVTGFLILFLEFEKLNKFFEDSISIE
jgi:hypothetical protein